jgi:hypothetical protein
MKILIYDTECSSLDVIGGYVMELAWAIFDVKTWRCLQSYSSLISWGRQYPAEDEALAITGLTQNFCELNGRNAKIVFSEFLLACSRATYLCGHNAIGYDKPMLLSNIKRAEAFSNGFHATEPLENIHHIDTLVDCPFPATQKVHALKYLALDHGYVLSGAHEAINDVFACAHILKQYPFEKVLEISKTPLVTMTAKVAWEDTAGRDRIKNSRFYWNAKTKLWEKKIRGYWVPGIQLQLGSDIELQLTPSV